MMKKLIYFFILFAAGMQAQNVGINTTSPSSTLQVAGSPADAAKPDGIIAPRLTLSQLNSKTAYGTAQTGAIVYVSDISGTKTTPTNAVNVPGYYFFDGTKWSGMQSQSGYAVFIASLGNGSGTDKNATISAGGFNTVPLNTVSKNIGGGSWDATNYIYTVPISGTYIIKSSVRLTDNSTSRNIFQAVGTSNSDVAEGIWTTSNPNPNNGGRWTMLYNRIAYFNKGDQVRLYIYSDGATANISDASLNIVSISAN